MTIASRISSARFYRNPHHSPAETFIPHGTLETPGALVSASSNDTTESDCWVAAGLPPGGPAVPAKKRVVGAPYRSCSSSAVTSSGRRSSFSSENESNCPARARAKLRSTSLATTPVSVTWPRFTIMWIGGFALAP